MSLNKKKFSFVTVSKDYGTDGSEESLGPYFVAGRFQADFPAVCRERGLPYVPDVRLRPVPQYKAKKKQKDVEDPGGFDRRGGKPRRTTQRPTTPGSNSGANLKPAVQAALFVKRLSGTGMPTTTLPPNDARRYTLPCTYLTRDKLEFFRPCVQVELEKEDDDRTVTEIYVCGWKVDMAMMEVFQQCWPALSMLHTVHLWNVGLAANTLTLLTSLLPLCDQLNTLVLDANSLGHLQVSDLLAEDSHLEHLSLRFCGITDIGAQAMAETLRALDENGKNLVTLNLANNQIGDTGAVSLADALKTNRSLLVLNLSSNGIGDEGAVQLAEMLSWFRVKKAHLLARRHLLRADMHKITERRRKSTKLVVGIKKPDLEVQSKRRLSQVHGKLSAMKVRSLKELKMERLRSHMARETILKPPTIYDSISTDDIDDAKPKAVFRTSRRRPERFSPEDRQVEGHGSHPLLQTGYIHDGDLWLPGNYSLISLNLSRNQVGEAGLRALLEAMECQGVQVCETGEKGLRRLLLHRNAFPESSQAAQKLQYVMKLRDPEFQSTRIDLQKESISPCALPIAVNL